MAIWNVERSTRDWGVPFALFGPGAAVSTVVAGSAPQQAGLAGGQILIALFNQQVPSAGGRGLLIDRKTGSVLAQLLHPSGPIKVASFSRDGRRLVTGSVNGTISLWDTSFADLGKVDRRSSSPMVVIRANSRDSDHVLTASADGKVRFLNVATGDEVWAVAAGFGPLEDAQLDPNEKYLVLRDSARRMRVYSVDPTRSRGSVGSPSLRDEAEDVGAAAFDASGERLIVGQGDGSVWLWDLPGLDKRKVHQAQAPARHVGVSRGGSHVMSGHGQVTLRRDNNLYVWTVKEPTHVVALYGHSLPILGSEVQEDAGRALSYGMDGRVLLWDLKRIDAAAAANGSPDPFEPLATITAGRPRNLGGRFVPADVRATFSKSGKRFVTVGDTAEVWDSGDGHLVAHLRGHSGAIKAAAFSDDDTLVATAGTDMTVRVWNPESGAEIFVFRGHTRQVRALSFAGATQSLLSASDDGTVRVWEMRPRVDTLIGTVLEILPRKQMTPAEQLLLSDSTRR